VGRLAHRNQPGCVRVPEAGAIETYNVKAGFLAVGIEVVDEAKHGLSAKIEDQLRKQVFGVPAGAKNAKLLHFGKFVSPQCST
jgi:hypothetical protein